jgi:hypothetical protein
MKERAPKQKKGITRREVLGEVGSLVVNATVAGEVAAIVGIQVEKIEKQKKYLASREGGYEESLLFRSHVENLKKQFPKSHMKDIRENANLVSVHDKGMTRAGLIDQYFMNEKTVSELPSEIREELHFLGLGLAANESSLDNSADSGKATRIFQFTKDTYETFTNPDTGKKFTAEDMKLLYNQVVCANLLFQLRYRELTKSLTVIDPKTKEVVEDILATIEERYYKGNPERFLRQFIVPALLGAYHGGPVRIAEAIKWFANQPTVAHAEGFDVYEALAQSLKLENEAATPDPVPGFGKFSRDYVANVYAFAFLVREDMEAELIKLTTAY